MKKNIKRCFLKFDSREMKKKEIVKNINKNNMDKIKKLNEEIEILQKEKEKELLRLEVEKLKKTVVEETVIKRKVIEYDLYPKPYYYGESVTCDGTFPYPKDTILM